MRVTESLLHRGLWRQGPLALGIAAGVLLVATVHDPVFLDAAVEFLFYLLLSASWNLMAGYAGQLSFAHMTFAVIGGYVTAGLADGLGVSPLATIPVAGIATALVGTLLGVITLRFRDIYLALATFAFAGAFLAWALATDAITGGSNGMSAPPLFEMEDQTLPSVWLALGLVILFYILQAAILASRWGLFARAVRDREEVARGLGVHTTRVKVLACAYAALWAGIAGGFYGSYVGIVSPSLGLLSTMGLVLAMVVVGGMGRAAGPLLGTLLFRGIDYFTRGYGGQYTVFIFAILMLLAMLFARNGIMGLIDLVLARLGRRKQRWAAGPAAEESTAVEPLGGQRP
jgi:branched-chain amino acid transport system permease protein